MYTLWSFIIFFRQRRIDEEPALAKAKEQIASMINELRDFKKEQAALTNELEQLKFKKSEYSDKIVKWTSPDGCDLINHYFYDII